MESGVSVAIREKTKLLAQRALGSLIISERKHLVRRKR